MYDSLGEIKKSFYFCIAFEKNGRIAQLVQSICLTSRGSAVRIRLRPQPFSILLIRILIGRIAQLVQSICLTSRGSAVRIRLRPHRFRYITPKVFRAHSSAGSEHLPYKQRVGGSNPSAPTLITSQITFGRIAQLVQSICLTSRGSAVRIRLRPHMKRKFDFLFFLYLLT